MVKSWPSQRPQFYSDWRFWSWLSLLNYVPFILLCPTHSQVLCALVPRVLHALMPYVPHPYVLFASPLICSHAPCPSSCPTCSCMLCTLCLTCSCAFCLTCQMCSCTSGVLHLACLWAACALNSMCSFAPRPSLVQLFQTWHALMHLMSCRFDALCFLYFCYFSYLSFLRSGLRLIIVIDSNKDTLNTNDINPLWVATYIKNEFQHFKKGFKSNWEVLVMFTFESAQGDHNDSLFKKFWIVLSHYHVYSILLENINTLIQSDLIMCFNWGCQKSGNWVLRKFADIAVNSLEWHFLS